jgi:hypothetical protein
MEAEFMYSALTGRQSREKAAVKIRTRRERRRYRAQVWRRGRRVHVGNVLSLRLD